MKPLLALAAALLLVPFALSPARASCQPVQQHVSSGPAAAAIAANVCENTGGDATPGVTGASAACGAVQPETAVLEQATLCVSVVVPGPPAGVTPGGCFKDASGDIWCCPPRQPYQCYVAFTTNWT